MEVSKKNLARKRLNRNFANFKCEPSGSGAFPQSILFYLVHMTMDYQGKV